MPGAWLFDGGIRLAPAPVPERVGNGHSALEPRYTAQSNSPGGPGAGRFVRYVCSTPPVPLRYPVGGQAAAARARSALPAVAAVHLAGHVEPPRCREACGRNRLRSFATPGPP